MTGQTCPNCGGLRDSRPPVPGPGATPACGCAAAGTGAAPQPAETTTGKAGKADETAAAEDFDPLRIRPYVTLPNADGSAREADGAAAVTVAVATVTGEAAGRATTGAPAGTAGTAPVPLAGDAGGTGGTGGAGNATGSAGGPVAADETMRLPAVPPEARGPVRHAGPMPPVAPTPGGGSAGGGGAERPDPVQPRRKRPFVALGVAAAVVVMIGTASVLGGVFDGDEAARQENAPESTTSVPDSTAGATDAPAEPSSSASASATASPSATTASASPSASATTSTSPSAGASAAPTASAGMQSPTPSNPTSAPPVDASPPATTAPLTGGTLQQGDSGSEVAELQNRLREARVYFGPIDSTYGDRVRMAVSAYQAMHGIQGDPSGVYGPHTRSALEAATSGKSRH